MQVVMEIYITGEESFLRVKPNKGEGWRNQYLSISTLVTKPIHRPPHIYIPNERKFSPLSNGVSQNYF